jgi:hypothetical protein
VLLLVGLLAALLIGGIPTAHAASPVLTVSSSTTNPGGTVMITGTGWAPAKHYNLYVYGQAKCKPNPICPPPATAKPINASPVPINSNGTLREFDFSFISNAAATTYVFTVVADYPADAPYTASVLVQVVPAGTPPSGTPVSSSPTAAPTNATPTTAPASPTATSQSATAPGDQTTTTPTGSSGSNTLAIIVVTVLLLIAVGVLIWLLIVLPPKRRAIRAAWYGAGNTGSAGATGARRYGASGPPGPGARRTTGGYPPVGDPELPWTGGVARWDDEPRPPRGSRPMPPRPPRRPPGREY